MKQRQNLKKALSFVLALAICLLLFPHSFASAEKTLAEEIRDKMIARENEIVFTIGVPISVSFFEMSPDEQNSYFSDYINSYMSELYTEVFAHCTVPKGGDYLYHHLYGKYSFYAATTGVANNAITTEITMIQNYFTTAEQETAVDDKIAKVIKNMDLNGKTDYEKIYAAYNYCTTVQYDYTNLNNDEYVLKYSAYAALINGTSVCQGYANLFYLFMQLLGIDCRIITGQSHGEAHAWNIVKLGDCYYNCDSTWDCGAKTFSYFLRGSEGFSDDHTSDVSFCTEDFTTAYPISKYDYKLSHEHEWFLYETIKPTCSAEGEEIYHCRKCDEVKTVTLDPDPNAHVFNDPEVVDPTCLDDGYTLHRCIFCRYAYSDQTTRALGHDFSRADVAADKLAGAATCVQGAQYYYTCSRCEVVSDTLTFTEGKPDENAHVWSDWETVREATVGVPGEMQRTCANDPNHIDTKPIDALHPDAFAHVVGREAVYASGDTIPVNPGETIIVWFTIDSDEEGLIPGWLLSDNGFEIDYEPVYVDDTACAKITAPLDLPVGTRADLNYNWYHAYDVFVVHDGAWSESTILQEDHAYIEVVEELPTEITDESTGISVSFFGTAFDGDVDFAVNAINGDNVQLPADYLEFAAYELVFTINGMPVQLKTDLTVKIPVPEGYPKDGILLYFISEGGEPQEVSFCVQNGSIVFSTSTVGVFVAVNGNSVVVVPPEYHTGDVDGSGEITPGDARLALRISLGLMKDGETDMTPEMVARADVDGKDGVQPADARLILRKSLGLIDNEWIDQL